MSIKRLSRALRAVCGRETVLNIEQLSFYRKFFFSHWVFHKYDTKLSRIISLNRGISFREKFSDNPLKQQYMRGHANYKMQTCQWVWDKTILWHCLIPALFCYVIFNQIENFYLQLMNIYLRHEMMNVWYLKMRQVL